MKMSDTIGSIIGPNQNFDQLKRQVAFEIEVEGVGLPGPGTVQAYWDVTSDGSLTAGGFEYVLKRPMNSRFRLEALRYLERKVKESGANVQWSANCSTHLHVNVRLLNLRQLYNFICLLVLFEDHLTDRERFGNNFCVRISECDDYIMQLARAAKEGDFFRSFRREVAKYMNFNVSSVVERGSLEARGYTGTFNPTIQEQRAQNLLRLRTAAVDDFRDPKDILTAISHLNPSRFAERYFPEISQENVDKLWENAMAIQEIVYASAWEDGQPIMGK